MWEKTSSFRNFGLYLKYEYRGESTLIDLKFTRYRSTPVIGDTTRHVKTS